MVAASLFDRRAFVATLAGALAVVAVAGPASAAQAAPIGSPVEAGPVEMRGRIWRAIRAARREERRREREARWAARRARRRF